LPSIEIVAMTFFIMILFLGVFLVIFGIPGNAVIFLTSLIYALIMDFERIGWKTLLILFILAVITEAIEFMMGWIGVPRFGTSVKGFWAAAFGSFLGALIMVHYLLGLGILVGIFVGGLGGVILVEIQQRGRVKPSLRTATSAIAARIAGMALKGLLCITMTTKVLIQIYS